MNPIYIRWAAGTGARALQETGISTIFVEGFTNAEAAAEGAILSVWQYQELKDKADQQPNAKVDLFEDSDRYDTENKQRFNLIATHYRLYTIYMKNVSFQRWMAERAAQSRIAKLGKEN